MAANGANRANNGRGISGWIRQANVITARGTDVRAAGDDEEDGASVQHKGCVPPAS